MPFSEKPDEVVAFFVKSMEYRTGGQCRRMESRALRRNPCFLRRRNWIYSDNRESAISAGNRRIEAVAGSDAFDWANQRILTFNQLLRQLACKPEEIIPRITQIQEKNKDLEKKIRSFTQKNQAGLADELIKNATEVGNIRIIKASVENIAANDLRPWLPK